VRIVLFNAPPRAGKDAAADAVLDSGLAYAVKLKFANILKDRTHALYGLSCDTNAFEDSKDEVSDLFHGLTPRQAYIAVSETYFKKVHGEAFFGHLLAEQIEAEDTGEDDDLIVVSDSGFRAEAEVIVSAVGASNVTLVRIHREDHDFRSDSRGYIDLSDLGVRTIDVHNDRTLVHFQAAVRKIVEALLAGTLDHDATVRA